MKKMLDLEEKFEKEEEPIEFETGDQVCSVENIQIPTNMDYISNKNTGKVDDSYDLDF